MKTTHIVIAALVLLVLFLLFRRKSNYSLDISVTDLSEFSSMSDDLATTFSQAMTTAITNLNNKWASMSDAEKNQLTQQLTMSGAQAAQAPQAPQAPQMMNYGGTAQMMNGGGPSAMISSPSSVGMVGSMGGAPAN